MGFEEYDVRNGETDFWRMLKIDDRRLRNTDAIPLVRLRTEGDLLIDIARHVVGSQKGKHGAMDKVE